MLLTVPNKLGVDYNAHVIEALLKRVAPVLGWRRHPRRAGCAHNSAGSSTRIRIWGGGSSKLFRRATAAQNWALQNPPFFALEAATSAGTARNENGSGVGLANFLPCLVGSNGRCSSLG